MITTVRGVGNLEVLSKQKSPAVLDFYVKGVRADSHLIIKVAVSRITAEWPKPLGRGTIFVKIKVRTSGWQANGADAGTTASH